MHSQRISQNLTRLAIRRGELVQANLVRGFDILKADLSSSWSWAMGIGVGWFHETMQLQSDGSPLKHRGRMPGIIQSSNRTGRSCPHTTAIYTFCTDWRQNMPGNKHNTWNDRTSSQILHKQPTLHKPPTKHVKRGILFRCLWHANRRCDERQNLRFGSRVSE